MRSGSTVWVSPSGTVQRGSGAEGEFPIGGIMEHGEFAVGSESEDLAQQQTHRAP